MHKTAIRRKTMSAPVNEAWSRCLIQAPVLDFGCGSNVDAQMLTELYIKSQGYDPNTPEYSKMPKGKFKTVLCIYVLNTVENPEEVLRKAWSKVAPGGRLIVACRSDKDIESNAHKNKWTKLWKGTTDGWVTQSGSYQKGYSLENLIGMTIKIRGVLPFVEWFKVHGNPCVIVQRSSGLTER